LPHRSRFIRRIAQRSNTGVSAAFPRRGGNKGHWQCAAQDGEEAVAGYFQTQAAAAEGAETLPLTGFDAESVYTVETRPQSLFIKQFGGLVKHILPVPLNPDGIVLRTVGRFYRLTDCVESYECRGDMLNTGLRLNNQFIGSYYNDKTRLLGDFGSNLYVIRKHHQA
jgi:alpha-galactosidase